MRIAGGTAALALGWATALAAQAPVTAPAQTATPQPDGALYISADGVASSDPGFERVINDPGEPELNLAYARERAAAGDLIGTAAALERLLLAQPNWHAARLFYAATLYRLDNLQEAKRELALLDGKTLTPVQRQEVEKFRRLIERRGVQTILTGEASLGLAYDSDAVGALANAVDLGAGIPLSDDGLAVVATAGLGVTHQLGDAVSLYAGANAVSKTDVSGVDQRYIRVAVAAGAAFKFGGSVLRAGGLYRHIDLYGDPFLDEYGGRLELVTRLTRRTALTANLEVTEQDYQDPVELLPPLDAAGRSGTRWEAGFGLTHRLTARQTIAVEIGYEDKAAGYRPYAHRGPRLYGAWYALLGRGAYASLVGQLRFLDYRAPDVLLTGVKRRDTRTFVRGALGAPFSAFTTAGATGDYREHLRLEGALSYASRESRAPYLDYDSVGAELRMIYRFGE